MVFPGNAFGWDKKPGPMFGAAGRQILTLRLGWPGDNLALYGTKAAIFRFFSKTSTLGLNWMKENVSCQHIHVTSMMFDVNEFQERNISLKITTSIYYILQLFDSVAGVQSQA